MTQLYLLTLSFCLTCTLGYSHEGSKAEMGEMTLRILSSLFSPWRDQLASAKKET
jgi:hypothetical protein